MKKIITIIFIFSGIITFAQEGALPFLNINANVRSAGMGNTIIGDATGMYIYTNPTSFLTDSIKKVYGSYTLAILPKVANSSTRFHSAAVGYKLGKQSISVGFRYLGGVEIRTINESGISGKNIKPFDCSLDLNYARYLGNNFSVYATGTFIQSHLIRTTYTGGLSGGIYYRNAFSFSNRKVSYNFGTGFYNVGLGIKSSTRRVYDLPTSFGIGGSFSTELVKNHCVNLGWTSRYFILPTNDSGITAGVGLEYELHDMFAIRTGYYKEDNNNLITLGLGIKYDKYNFDLSYQKGEYNTLHLGCDIKF